MDGRQHVFVYEDLTSLLHKLLEYMQKSCSDTFSFATLETAISKLSSRHLKNWSPSLHLIISKHGIDVDYKQMGCGKIT